MSDRATALLAFWNDVEPAHDEAYNAWHGDEHVPQRCSVPGVLWAQRYGQTHSGAAQRYMTLYGLRDARVLEEEGYQRLLREPTLASRAMRPMLLNLSRWVCRLHACRLTGATNALVATALAEAPPATVGALVLAERVPDASPLPWMNRRQDRQRNGLWLLCSVADGMTPDTPLPDGAVLYQRLAAGC
ncbi:DUF4286 family protein [Variovorax sp. E3]|uniref:DUF4286 family protein n=1 Tax=Variovorax sp. E3 TaxID=1914993 RepID=UPI0018DE7B63|nr:DUF4286 family protein [Variovorax sp. E3]